MSPGSDAGSVAVVVVHHRHPGVEGTLAALAAQEPAPGRVLVVDSASGDGSASRLRAAGREVLEVPNRGYAAAANAGLRAVRSDQPSATLLLTHECELRPGALERLLSALWDDPGLGAVGPLLAWSDAPGRVWSAGGELRAGFRFEHRNQPEAVEAWTGRGTLPADWLDGACWLVRREALDEVGPLDERYFLYFEETDWFLRAAEAGWRFACVTGAVATQAGSGIPVELAVRNRLLLVRRRRPLRLPAEILAQLRRVGGFARHRDRRAALLPAARGLLAGVAGKGGPLPADRLRPRIDPEWREGFRLR